MDSVGTVFLVVGVVGVLVLLASLLVGEIGGFLSADADGPFSLPAIAALIGGIGFGGAATSALLPSTLSTGLVVGLSALVGVVVAIPLAYATIRFSTALQNMPTDATLTRADLLGSMGIVVSAIPTGGFGEVRLAVAGQQLKYHARSEHPLSAGTPVYVVDTPTETSVEVVSTAELANPEGPLT